MRSRLVPIARKELYHILRDARSLVIIFVLPIVMMLLYGYAITFDIKHIKMAVLDYDNSAASQELVEKFTSGGLFREVARLTCYADIEERMLRSDIQVALVVPARYHRDIVTLPTTSVQLLVDGSNANTATVILNYARMILAASSLQFNARYLQPPADIRTRVLYNSDMRSMVFIVPGLAAVLMMMICTLLTSIAIARERETGTMEQLLMSPIRPLEMIFGKVLPYVFIAMLDGALVVAFSKYIFDIPMRGSPLLLFLLSIVYLYASLSLGILISSRAANQRAALMGAMVATMLPSILLSGFIFPIRSMPKVLQIITHIVPARYYLNIIRGIMLKGVGIRWLWQDVVLLFGFGTLLLLISSGRFKTNLEG